MAWPRIKMIFNQPVTTMDEYLVFKDLVKSSCSDLKISAEDDFFTVIDKTQIEIENLFEELIITVDPQRKQQLVNQINSCRNLLVTQLHQRYIENSGTTDITDNL